MTLAAADHPLLGGLLGDPEVAALFAPDHTLAAHLAFEVALADAGAAEGLIAPAAAAAIAAAAATFRPDLAALRADIGRDGVAVPGFVRQLRHHIGPPHDAALHRAATSQDLVDTALVLALRDVDRLLLDRLAALRALLDDLDRRFGAGPLMGRTRLQAALPITVGDRLRAWRAPLARAAAEIAAGRADSAVLQFGGPVGDRRGLDGRGDAVAARLAAALGLASGPCWHSDRSRITAHGDRLARLCGGLGKLGQDVGLMAQQGISEIVLAGGGGSSAMAHKQNPVAAETLVALARFAAVQAGGLHQAAVHEQERSGAAWTLEWLLLPPLCGAAGAATARALEMLAAVERLGPAD